MRYGEEIISNFDVKKDLELWENTCPNDYFIHITLPEFCALCPRSGYPSFMNRHISHEKAANEIYSTLFNALKPKYMELRADFNPRGNVHTIIELNSNQSGQTSYNIQKNTF